MGEVEVKVSKSESFYSNDFAIIHSPKEFILDFRQTTPQVNVVKGKPKTVLVVQHISIILRPELAKQLMLMLEDNLRKFEKKFGEIEVKEKKLDYIG